MLTTYQQFFTGRSTIEIARSLLGKRIIYHGPLATTGGLIVETEAYLGEHDSASHAFKGRRTNYSKSLYGQPGDAYIYQIRGHYCFDVVVQDVNEPQGVLIRAIEPTDGLEQMQLNRGMTGAAISNGPGKLMQALGIQSRQLDGHPLETGPLTIDLQQRIKIPREIITTSRIGVNLAGSNGRSPYRFFVQGNPYVSGMRKRDTDLLHHGWKER